MPTYRLTFNTLDVNQKPSERVMDGNNTLGAVLGPIADAATILGQDFRTSLHGVTSFAIRFSAVGDHVANVAAERAVSAIRDLPVDGVKVERRSNRGYVPTAVTR